MKKETKERTVLGILESVAFPDLGIAEVLAKVDTGAYSGAIHCESIEEQIDATTGKKILKIVPIDATCQPVVIRRYSKVVARSSTGHLNKRYIITTKMNINGEQYDIRIGLTKRSLMNVKVLIGRRFMREYDMLVDVTLNEQLDNDGGRK